MKLIAPVIFALTSTLCFAQGQNTLTQVQELKAIFDNPDLLAALRGANTIDGVIKTQFGYDLISGDCTLHVATTSETNGKTQVGFSQLLCN